MDNMKPLILFDGTSITKRMKGVGRYAWNLLEQMDRRLGNDYHILVLHFESERLDLPPFFRGTLLPVPRVNEARFGLFSLRKLVANYRPAILIRPSDTIGIDYGVPTVTVCHDLNTLIWAAQGHRLLRRRIIDTFRELFRGYAMRKSELVICNSRFVMDAAAQHFNLDRSRMTIAPCGVEMPLLQISDRIDLDEVRRHFSGQVEAEEFLLTFATGDTREGFDVLPEFWENAVKAGYPGALIIAGVQENAEYARELKERFSSFPSGKKVVWLPFLDASRVVDLAGLYASADFYLEFSRHEGFGMQLVEAMACGTVCFSTGQGALAEVGGGLTLPLIGDPAVDGQAVTKAWREGRHIGQRGIVSEHARKFTWDQAGLAVSKFVRSNSMRDNQTSPPVCADDREKAVVSVGGGGQAPVMCLFIEPAPYITRLDQELKKQWPGRVSTWFVSDATSQKWDSLSENNDFHILPKGKIAALCALWRSILQYHPKIIFVAGWSHPVIIGAIMMAKLAGARVISTSDTWKSESTGIRKWGKKSVLRMIDRFTPGGKRQAKYLRDIGVPENHIFPANMTVDTKAMQVFFAKYGAEHRRIIRHELGIDDRGPVFLFVGRLESIKGMDLLLSAFGEFDPSVEARLVIVGDGTLRREAENAMERDTRIVYRGRLEGEALWAQFAAADVLVAPSLSEPWGLVVNEALSAGLAIVVSDEFGCTDDLINPEQNALIVPTGNQVAVSEVLKRLSSDPHLLERLRGNAMQSVEGWTTEAWAANILAAWWDAMNQKESSSEHV